jgi:hypothetical protein
MSSLRQLSASFLVLAGCSASVRAPIARAPVELVPQAADPPQPLAFVAVEAVDGVVASPVAKQVHLTLSRAAPVVVVCTSPDDAAEHFVFRPSAAAVEQRIDVFGLLADTAYVCTATASDPAGFATSAVSFATGSLPDTVPTVALDEDDGENQGYIAYNHSLPTGYVVLDRDARVRWFDNPAADANADLGVELAWQPDLQQFLTCGGNFLVPHLTNLFGQQSWSAPRPVDSSLTFHHDCARLPDGSVLALEAADATLNGVGVNGTSINEYTVDGALAWQWTTQQGIDQGRLSAVHYGPGIDMDPWHANSVAWLDDSEGPAVFLSHYGQGDVLRIDRTTGQISWILSGVGGDFALVDVDGNAIDARGWFDGQHGLDWQMETDGLHALIYDNGRSAGQSRVLELRIDPVARVATELWTFTEPQWFTPIWGDADWLPDGRVLVAKGHCAACDRVDPDERSEILVLDPAAGVVTWRVRFEASTNAIYRAEQIDGCDLFANSRFCPELLVDPLPLQGAGELHAVAADEGRVPRLELDRGLPDRPRAEVRPDLVRAGRDPRR